MENTSYGINVANRYDLFCIDDDAGDPMEAILKNKQKQQKKQQAAASSATATGAPAPGAAAAAAGGGAQPQQPSAQAKSNAKGGGEKENKSAGGRGAENRHPDKSTAQTNGTGNLHNQRGTERRGIKETQKDNIRNQENQKTGGVGGAGGNQGNAKLPRGTGPNHKNGILAPGGGGGNDDKYRKTRDFDDGQRKPYPQNGGAAGGGPKRFDGRGKRELDRQSGSNKTGIKSVDKRDGAGSHNWGSSKQDAKEFSNLQDQEYQPQDADTSADEKTNPERTNAANGGEGETADGAANAKSEDEAKEMTLDEWKAQKAAVRLKPQYNLRKAGEGENSAQWDKMVALDRKPVKAGEAEAEDDENNDTQKAAAGGKGGKQVLEIEFHFNDNRRGGLGRTRGGRGGKGGGRGMGRDGPGGRRGEFGGENYRSSGAGGEHGYHQDGGAGGGGAPEGGMERPQRDNVRRNNRPPFAGGGGGPDRSYDGGMNKYSRPNPRASKQQHAPAAPKVDDEHDFPSLG